LQKIKNTQIDTIFFQASLPKEVWDLTVEVMDHFEQADLRGQTRNFSNLICKPEFRQNYLTPIRTLAVEDQCSLLQKVINRTISLAEMKNEAAEMKKMIILRKAFVKCTSSQTWENAKQKFPFYATDNQLKRFVKVDVQKEVPQSFMDFCRRAAGEEGDHGSAIHNSVHFNTAVGFAIDSKISELNSHRIKQVFSNFYGAKLSIITCADVSIMHEKSLILYIHNSRADYVIQS